MNKIIEGARRYERESRARYLPLFAELGAEQRPHTLFITCADSRVVPNLIASGDPGELFVLRNIANIVPPFAAGEDTSVSAAISYGVGVLGVTDIVVCGHSSCGGAKAMLGDPPSDPDLRRWLEHGRRALAISRQAVAAEPERPSYDQLSMRSAVSQLASLRTYPIVRARLDEGALHLHAWWFEVASGRVLAFSPEQSRYVGLEQVAAAPGEA